MQGLRVDTPEGPQVSPKCRACSLTGVAMDFALAIPIIIARPLIIYSQPIGFDFLTTATHI
jgi:hypothetical protein